MLSLRWKDEHFNDHWHFAFDGDPIGFELYKRHYSSRKNELSRKRSTDTRFVGPGEKLVLISDDKQAVFAWRKFIDDCDWQYGINNSLFRNEGHVLSSVLIREASERAMWKWPKGERLYTYVRPDLIRSNNPGCCYIKAGWKRSPYQTAGGHVVLELLY